MTFNVDPHIRSSRRHGLFLAALLATACASAVAQGSAPAGSSGVTATETGPRGQHRGRHDPSKMQAMVAKHQADLKTKLKITSAQEAAWTNYTTAMQPPAVAEMGRGMRPTDAQRAEMDKLSTPERIDMMRAMRTGRMTQMNAQLDKRGNAAKDLYTALTPEQQKVFDTEYQKRGPRGEHGRRGDHRTS